MCAFLAAVIRAQPLSERERLQDGDGFMGGEREAAGAAYVAYARRRRSARGMEMTSFGSIRMFSAGFFEAIRESSEKVEVL